MSDPKKPHYQERFMQLNYKFLLLIALVLFLLLCFHIGCRYYIYNKIMVDFPYTKLEVLTPSNEYKSKPLQVVSVVLELPENCRSSYYWSNDNNAYRIVSDEFKLILSKPWGKNVQQCSDEYLDNNIPKVVSNKYFFFPSINNGYILVYKHQNIFQNYEWYNYCANLKELRFIEFCLLSRKKNE